jgi:hypothetical protein
MSASERVSCLGTRVSRASRRLDIRVRPIKIRLMVNTVSGAALTRHE